MKLTAKSMENAALYYVQRYSTTARRVREVLLRKARRAAGAAFDAKAANEMISALIVRLTARGLIDDARFAEHRAATLRERGASRLAIRRKLQLKGVGSSDLAKAVAELGGPEEERAAALRYAERRRLGRFRSDDAALDAERLRKDLAAMARAGFGYRVSREVLESSSGSTRRSR